MTLLALPCPVYAHHRLFCILDFFLEIPLNASRLSAWCVVVVGSGSFSKFALKKADVLNSRYRAFISVLTLILISMTTLFTYYTVNVFRNSRLLHILVINSFKSLIFKGGNQTKVHAFLHFIIPITHVNEHKKVMIYVKSLYNMQYFENAPYPACIEHFVWVSRLISARSVF